MSRTKCGEDGAGISDPFDLLMYSGQECDCACCWPFGTHGCPGCDVCEGPVDGCEGPEESEET